MAITLCCRFRSCFTCLFTLTILATVIYTVLHYFILNKHLPVSDVQESYFPQTLDHFSRAPVHKFIFQQRYFVDRTYWAGGDRRAPIFVFLGGAANVKPAVGQVGILTESAPRFGGLVVYIEHRFYGVSTPLGSIQSTMNDPVVRGYLTTDQVLADFAEIITSLQANLSAMQSPVIVIGNFYGGILATWFGLKYPNIVTGVLASSAPMFYFYGIAPQITSGFCATVSNDYKEVNPQCHDMIRQSWSMIDNIATQPRGLDILSSRFKTCSNLASTYELKSYLARLYIFAAKTNGRFNDTIGIICDSMMSSFEGDIIDRIAEALFTMTVIGPCHNTSSSVTVSTELFGKEERAALAWQWQVCTDLVVSTSCENNEMGLPVKSFDISQHIASCQLKYGETPRPNWIKIQYGENRLESILAKSGTNIIFSNGLKDPYSTLGVLKDISHKVVAIKTEQGSHSLDLDPARNDDPKWLVQQRHQEIKIFAAWIKSYHNSHSNKLKLNLYLYIFCQFVLLLIMY